MSIRVLDSIPYLILALPAAAQGGSDDCSTPEVILGSSSPAGGISIDFENATTGTQGQGYAACQWGGTRAFERDLWFVWTAPGHGIVDMHVQGSDSATDPRLGVYEGSSCASLPPFECNDDGTGLSSLTPWVRFEATAGEEYLIHVGLFPGSYQPPMGGALRWWTSPLEEQYGYIYDDGEQDGGGPTLLQDGEVAWLQRFNAHGGSDVISAVWASFGDLEGTLATVHIWEDPDDDGLPDDAVLLASATAQIEFASTNTLMRIPFSAPVAVDAKFFVGVSVPTPANSTVVEVDDHEFPNWSWLAGNIGAPFDATCLPCNSDPPRLLREHFIEGTFLLRAEGMSGLIATYCSDAPPGWAWCHPRMHSSGTPSFTGSDFKLEASDAAPNRSGILFWGVVQARIPFMGSFKCIASPVSRTPIQNSGDLGAPPCAGTFSFDWTTAYMSSKGISPGDTIYAQHWFREPTSPGTVGFSEALSFVVVP